MSLSDADLATYFAAFSMPLAALVAVLLDRLLGEAQRFHPLVGFGNLVATIEKRLNRRTRLTGVFSWMIAAHGNART